MKKVFVVLALFAICMIFGQIASMAECPVTGVYQSDWGQVNLLQAGNQVTGTWEKGTIQGTRFGNTIRYVWYQGNVIGGRGFWTVSPDCQSLTGPWGNGNSETGGGYWNLHK